MSQYQDDFENHFRLLQITNPEVIQQMILPEGERALLLYMQQHQMSIFLSTDLAPTFEATVANMSTKLKALYDKGYLLRTAQVQETGGIEYLYWPSFNVPRTDLPYTDNSVSFSRKTTPCAVRKNGKNVGDIGRTPSNTFNLYLSKVYWKRGEEVPSNVGGETTRDFKTLKEAKDAACKYAKEAV